MPLAIVCGGCKRKLRIPDKLVGKPVKCPGCARKLKVGGKTVLQTTSKKETVVVTTPKKASAAKASAPAAAKKPGTTAKKPKPPATPTGSMPKPTFPAPPVPAPRPASGSGMLLILGGGGVLVILVALGIGYFAFVGMGGRPQPKNYIVPEGFDESLLDKWKCTENGSALRFADQKELDVINGRIHANKQLNWARTPVTEPVIAVLIRADRKIGYRVDHNVVPNMDPLAALLLDETLGDPDPNQNRK